jgi:hypothetical protein
MHRKFLHYAPALTLTLVCAAFTVQKSQAASAKTDSAPSLKNKTDPGLSQAKQKKDAPPEPRYPWRLDITTTTFWVGEQSTKRNPTHNASSCWDPAWARNYGGTDTPIRERRSAYLPVNFKPRLNPFYFALPYNDVQRGKTKPEACRVIPWFSATFERSGKSVLKDRWIAIRFKDRVAFAQWADVGPFTTEHWQYVFGNERPKPNLNKAAGLDVSPAVRDYLGMQDSDVTDWRFVEFQEVPEGPWAQHGGNNTFAQNKRKASPKDVLAVGLLPLNQ